MSICKYILQWIKLYADTLMIIVNKTIKHSVNTKLQNSETVFLILKKLPLVSLFNNAVQLRLNDEFYMNTRKCRMFMGHLYNFYMLVGTRSQLAFALRGDLGAGGFGPRDVPAK